MAKITTACDCVLQAGFTIRNKVLAEGEYLVFRTVLLTDDGAVFVREVMTADGTGDASDTHCTLRYDLGGKQVVAGNYAWELLFYDSDGNAHCLLPAEDGKLTVYDRIANGEDTA
ncbi:MAG: hypothetical protein IJO14_07910 [Clostridia bacterium]|nr:hypothetical protein [Clostridia bacterium]